MTLDAQTARRAGGRRHTTRRLLVLATGTVVLAGAGLALPALPASADPVFTVNSLLDAPDAARDGVCRTSAGVCTFRAALTEANAATGHATVAFALPGVVDATSPAGQIKVTSKLPTITNPAGITVDGYTQVGSSVNTLQDGSNAVLKVEIVGPGVTNTFDGMQFNSSGNIIRGLSAYAFKHVIWFEGTSANNNSIVGNFICTDSTGTFLAQQVNGAAGGILIQDGASGNVVGTPALADRNIVSGCAHRGVIISFEGTRNNVVQNNVFGLTPSGTAALPDQSHGIDINYGASDNLAGGLGANQRNIVSGNAQEGIEVSHGTTNRGNKVLGNCIGTDLTCTKLLSYTGNGMMGIRLEGAKECNLTPDPPCGLNAGYIEVANNVVVGNGGSADPVNGPPWGGMLIDKGQQHNWVHDNLIGVLPDGTPAGNIGYGLRVEHHAMYNEIGPNNTIANSTLGGVQMDATESQPPDPSIYPTTDNPLVRNSIYGNGTAQSNRLGVDLAPFNVPNINGVGDANVAHAIQPPGISRLTGTGLSGTACAGCTVEAYLSDVTTLPNKPTYGQGKTFLASAVADSTGAYAVTFPTPLVSGQVVAALQTTPGEVDPADTAAGAFGDTSEFTRAIALGGPAAPTASGPAYVGPSNLTSVTITGQGNSSAATATGTLTGPGGTSVTATPVAVDPSTGAFTLTFDATSLADGPVSAAVSVADSTGQSSPSTTVTMTKDTVAPTVTASTPAAGSTVAAPSTVVSTISEPLASAPSVTLTGPSGAVSGSTALSADGVTVTFTPGAPLASGAYTEALTGADPAGNALSASTGFTVDATAPAAPTVSAADPVTGATQAAVSVTGSAEPSSTVTLTASDSTTHTATQTVTADATTGGWSAVVDMSGFDDGAVLLSATATDAVGNVSAPGSFTTHKATSGPKVVSSSPVRGSTVRSPATVTATFDRALASGWAATLAGTSTGPVAISSVLSADGKTVTVTPTAKLGSDSWTLTVQASDALGASTTSAVGFTVDAVAPTPPTLTLPSSISAANVAAVPVSGSTTAEAGDTVTVSFTAGGTTVTGTATTASSGAWSTTVNASTLPQGSVAVAATASDVVGNVSTVTRATLAKKTLSDPPGVKPFVWTINSITVSWAAPANTGGAPIDSYVVSWTPSGGSVTTATTTALTYTIANLPEGTPYTITVAAHTAAGNGTASAPKSVTTKWKTSATIAASTTKVPSGGSITLSGKLFRTSSPTTPIVGARIVLNITNSSTGTKTFVANQIPTASDGSWTYTYTPPKGGWRWTVNWGGDTVNGPAASPPTPVVTVS